MAIRASTVHANDQAFCQAILSGWSFFANGGVLFTFDDGLKAFTGVQPYQPAKLSRPGNLGTAYPGVWTGNVSG